MGSEVLFIRFCWFFWVLLGFDDGPFAAAACSAHPRSQDTQ